MKKRKKKRTQAVRLVDKQNRRKQQRRGWLKFFFLFLICFSFFAVWLKLHDPHLLPIKVVTLEGDYPHLDPKVLQRTIDPFTRSNFFTVDLVGLRERLLQFPWLQSVSISREWPNRLHIQLKEQQPIAIWNDSALLNNEGHLFNASKNKLTTALPHLRGPTGEQHRVWQTYFRFSKALGPSQLSITQLELTSAQTWSLKLNNGLRLVVGEDGAEEKLRRFTHVYATLLQTQTPIDYIDLRYDHGMAVRYNKIN
ncbi:MAG: FtsQ-type POTRA domain-containing protein [Gammaproteobacteria bacterium]|nr:FtsQ-type POTRA domain-containing protein [Gammaproteobacteria bacterium]